MKGAQNRKHTLHVQPVQPAGARACWLTPFQIATTRVLTFVRLTKLCHKSLCRLAVTCCRLSFQKSHEPQQIEFLLLWRHKHFNNDFCVLSASAQPEGGERNRERETEDGCCLLWLLCGCCRFGGGGTVEHLMKPSQVGTNSAEWECLIWSGLSLDRRHSIAEREIQ